ncbi:MAG: type II secretion system protein [Nitrospinae bacterium]|nr:type II secretion system protein [Nitrospinota bacterium]
MDEYIRNKKGEGGFSLIELMITIAIMSTIFYMVANTLYQKESRENEIYNAARDLGTYIQQYRMKTINENQCYLFSFSGSRAVPVTDSYSIYLNSACDGDVATSTLVTTVNLSSYSFNVIFGSIGSSGNTNDGISNNSFYIKPRGFLNTGTAVAIYFTSMHDYTNRLTEYQVRVRVDQLTGRVKLNKFRDETWSHSSST